MGQLVNQTVKLSFKYCSETKLSVVKRLESLSVD